MRLSELIEELIKYDIENRDFEVKGGSIYLKRDLGEERLINLSHWNKILEDQAKARIVRGPITKD